MMLIDGRLVAGETDFDVVDPSTGRAFASAPDCSLAQLEEAVGAGERAFRPWSRDIAARRQALQACATLTRAAAEEIGRLISQEQGKPLPKAVGEVMGSARWFEYTAGLELPVEIVRDDAEMHVSVHRRPLGLVAGITPWNYPVMSAVWKIAPALLAGNTIIIKPSPFTPLSTLRLGAILNEALPRGVLNIVSGGDMLGRSLSAHPAIRKVSLTGSVEAGKSVAAAVAPDLKRMTLELGGNDAAIVLDDVDPEAIAEKLFWGAFQNTGQVCSAIKRLYVQEKVFTPVRDALLARLLRTRVGNGLEDGVELGPLSTAAQHARVSELADAARSAGGQFHGAADAPDTGGYFYPASLVTGLDEANPLVADEQFGPVLPMLPFKDPAEAIERANATKFGLSGSVWSGDAARGTELAAELDCGTAWVNQHLAVLPAAPIAGHKWSGMGAENGLWGLHAYTEIQTVSVAR